MNWELLKKQEKLLLYGMGNGADKLLDIFSREGIKCDGVFASDEFVRGQSFRGYKVMTHGEAKEKFARSPLCWLSLRSFRRYWSA